MLLRVVELLCVVEFLCVVGPLYLLRVVVLPGLPLLSIDRQLCLRVTRLQALLRVDLHCRTPLTPLVALLLCPQVTLFTN